MRQSCSQKSHDLRGACNKVAPIELVPLRRYTRNLHRSFIDYRLDISMLSRTVELAAMPHASSSDPQKAPSDIWEFANLVFH